MKEVCSYELVHSGPGYESQKPMLLAIFGIGYNFPYGALIDWL